jgi:hypothetical protein
MEALLAGSTSSYVVVGGHHPVWSICEHGPTDIAIEQSAGGAHPSHSEIV